MHIRFSFTALAAVLTLAACAPHPDMTPTPLAFPAPRVLPETKPIPNQMDALFNIRTKDGARTGTLHCAAMFIKGGPFRLAIGSYADGSRSTVVKNSTGIYVKKTTLSGAFDGNKLNRTYAKFTDY